MRKILHKSLLLVAIMVLSLLLVTGCGPEGDDGAGKPKIIVSSKNFTEQLIVGNMVGLLMEDAGYPVDYKLRLGGTGLIHEALVNGEINVYIEYTGTALTVMLKEDPLSDPDEVYERVKEAYQEKWNLVWLEPWGFNNTYTVTMQREVARELGIEKISDLKDKAGDLVIGATQEFIPRPDGLAGLEEAYGFKFKEAKGMDPGLMYQALKEGEVDAISGFATDGRIPALDLINLVDDLGYFPPYYAAPVVRGDLLEKDPGIAEVLNKLAYKIDDTVMAELNYKVDGDKKDPAAVAKKFLQDNGFIE
ncbi:MAG: glycine betaine ABC transporter substrate-binding protein [Dethiobacteria bacterium]|nr:glycine betaine ABC transporter substrate-binding protein [Bacillota bacterium]HOB29639.1 glycine betaine ABC transporter substrate-binding protein [Bacillota bacterium]HPZ42249.1 glycine betaine ABC transporter substrate-binding protein [Bacillota bacterium]HQD53109.1 glycine betaine ABC transporter substrate-binding protein [Bacillota bacterium]